MFKKEQQDVGNTYTIKKQCLQWHENHERKLLRKNTMELPP